MVSDTRQSNTFCFARVALFTPLRKVFDYIIPEDQVTFISPGMRVLVPFGRQKKIGVIHEIHKKSHISEQKLKKIISILDKNPLLSESILKLIHWSSQYYQHPLGEVYEAAIPKKLRKMTEKEIKILSSTEDLIDQLYKKRNIKKNKLMAAKVLLKQNNRDDETKTHAVHHLNKYQQNAITQIHNSFGRFHTFLLDGVTGSGKTEIYMQLAQIMVAAKKQVLILVPEIGLTPQLLARFENRFANDPHPIAVLHSSLTDKKRYEAYEMARTGQVLIIIGTRSAIFTSLCNPGLFIIDEEHDASFKQQEGFRYHARDLMVLRASLENCPIVLGSATPSFESLSNITTKGFQHIVLPHRAGSAKTPSFKIFDIRHKKLIGGMSHALLTEIEKHLAEKGQVLLFLNRRGFAPVLMCFDCGYIALCNLCDAKMTVHHHNQKLICHHCEQQSPLLKECLKCQSQTIKPLGSGTERIENAITDYFPHSKIVRLDRDTMQSKGALEAAYTSILNQEAHIIIGTQMIAKGHDFPNVTLVAIIDTDQALYSNDFRSFERLGQLLTQVAGRAGRAEKLGEVILQTCHPEHPLLKLLIEKGYSAFSEKLLTERQLSSLPPFSYQALFRAEAKELAVAVQFLEKIKTELLKQKDLMGKNSLLKESSLIIQGPISSPMEKRIGKFHAQLLLQSLNRKLLQKILADLIDVIEHKYEIPGNLRYSIDVDPIDFF